MEGCISLQIQTATYCSQGKYKTVEILFWEQLTILSGFLEKKWVAFLGWGLLGLVCMDVLELEQSLSGGGLW